MAGIVRKSRVNKRFSSSACKWCLDMLALEEEGAACEACDSLHHARCWDEKNGCGNKACVNAPPPPLTEDVPWSIPRSSPFRRLLSSTFLLPSAGLLGAFTAWLVLEPYIMDTEDPAQEGWAVYLLFPFTGMLIVLFIFICEAIIYGKPLVNLKRWLFNLGFTVLFCFVAFIPAGVLVMLYGLLILFIIGTPGLGNLAASLEAHRDAVFISTVIYRSIAWAIFGTAIGLGMNLTRSTRAQRSASIIGGAVGGALCGLLFDPVGRFVLQNEMEGSLSRLISPCIMGLCMGFCLSLTERFNREGWIRVRDGALKGQVFILCYNPTIIGSSPQADIYLFKDPGIDASQAAIHHVGGSYEIEALRVGGAVLVNNWPVRRKKLSPGDEIRFGTSALYFEERDKRLFDEVRLK